MSEKMYQREEKEQDTVNYVEDHTSTGHYELDEDGKPRLTRQTILAIIVSILPDLDYRSLEE